MSDPQDAAGGAKLIVGCGYLGGRVAKQWRDQGQQVIAMTRSPQRARLLEQQGIMPLVADVMDPASLKVLSTVDTLLYSVGYDRSAGHTIEQVYAEGLHNVLGALSSAPWRIIYISTTGVYGDADGQWIDESAACQPQRAGGRASWAAETVLIEHEYANRAIILRLAGIYGPGRIPRRAELVGGQPIDAPAEGFLNLIHVEDAASVVVLVAREAVAPRIYNVSDGHPVQRAEYFCELARLLGAPPPVFVKPPANSAAAERARSNRRISNARLISELNVRFAYPSYREGLAAIVASEDGPNDIRRS